MADPHLRQEDLKTLDQARSRLFQLSSNIASLKNDITQSNPLPEWESLQASAAILAQNIRNMTDHLARHADLFQRVAVHPSANFPGRVEEQMLQQMLRKKLMDPAEEWVEEGRKAQATIGAGTEKDEEELWKWARDFIGERVAKYAIEEAGDNYTAAEREMGIENIRTGLRRKLDDDDEDDEDEDEDEVEDEEMEDVGVANTVVLSKGGQIEFGMEEVKTEKRSDGQARRLSDIMRYVTTGDPVRRYPSDKELEAKSNKSKDFSFS